MIARIIVDNFKSIAHQDLKFSNLTVLTGKNSSGKSSFIQVPLLFDQTHVLGYGLASGRGLFLGDENTHVRLGTFGDVFNQSADKKSLLKLQIYTDNTDFSFEAVEYDSDMRDAQLIDGTTRANLSVMNSVMGENLKYLKSDRISPNEDYPRIVKGKRLGTDGRYTAHYLELYGNLDIPIADLAWDKTVSKTLIHQVNSWMGIMSEGVQVHTQENLATNKVELSFRYKMSDGVPSRDHKPQNVGFGLTYALPVVVLILSAHPGDILLIENPETYLHPKGQSRLGMLMSLAANAGVQIIVETHSDHIVNGIRVAVKKKQIEKEKVTMHFFERKPELNLNTQVKSLTLNDEGKIVQEWPADFFDEWDNMLGELI